MSFDESVEEQLLDSFRVAWDISSLFSVICLGTVVCYSISVKFLVSGQAESPKSRISLILSLYAPDDNVVQ